jgi:hypothetical protein
MATKFRISFQNSGGELDGRTVPTEDELKDAVLEMIEDVDHLSSGDKIIITKIEE